MVEVTSYLDWEISHQPKQPSKKLQKAPESNFASLLKPYMEAISLHKMALLSENFFDFSTCDLEEGLISCVVKPPNDFMHSIVINKKKHTLFHDCEEFKEMNYLDKKFCSHLIKLFLILKERNLDKTNELLKQVSNEDFRFKS